LSILGRVDVSQLDQSGLESKRKVYLLATRRAFDRVHVRNQLLMVIWMNVFVQKGANHQNLSERKRIGLFWSLKKKVGLDLPERDLK
jgi:hypothetical protein